MCAVSIAKKGLNLITETKKEYTEEYGKFH